MHSPFTDIVPEVSRRPGAASEFESDPWIGSEEFMESESPDVPYDSNEELESWSGLDDHEDRVDEDEMEEDETPGGSLSLPIPVPANDPVPFAREPRTNSYWPVITSHSKGTEVSYQKRNESMAGKADRRFLALRSGGKRYHVAVDLWANHKDPVVACEDGRIVNFYHFYHGAWALLIEHDDLVINYGEVDPASLRLAKLKIGDYVKSGQQIGIVGKMHSSSMLHFETYVKGTKQNKRFIVGEKRPAALLNPTGYLLKLSESGIKGKSTQSSSVPAPSSRASDDWTRAIARNRHYSEKLGWGNYHDRINDLLLPLSGMQNVSLGEEAFAANVAVWQRKNGFTGKDVDGIIGPATWARMTRALGISASPSSLSLSSKDSVVSLILQYTALIEKHSRTNNLNPNIVRAIIAAESGGNPRAGENGSGYKGLMQAGQQADQLQPETSIRTGAEKFVFFSKKVLNPWLKKLGIHQPAENNENYLRACMSCYNAGPVTAMKAIQYAHASGNWEQWLSDNHYKRALLFSGGYARYQSCNKGKSTAEIDEAKKERLRYKFKTKGWRTEPDPPLWTSAQNSLNPITRCWIETKFRNTPHYLDKIIRYYRYFESNPVQREVEYEEHEHLTSDFTSDLPAGEGLSAGIAEAISREVAKALPQPDAASCQSLVCWAKSALKKLLGVDLPSGRALDESTKNALREFQSLNNLEQSGRVDATTERALLEAEALQRHKGTEGEAAAISTIAAGKAKIQDWTKQAVDVKKEITNNYRDPRTLFAFVLHQMAFKRRSRKSRQYSDPTSYLRTGAHYCIMLDGKIIQLHPISRLIWHAQCLSGRSVAVEFEGNFPNVKGRWWVDKDSSYQNKDLPTREQFDSGRLLASYLKVVLGTTRILAHRQSSSTRENDPGPDIWFNVGEWAINNLGMTDGGASAKCGTGSPILAAWRTWGNSRGANVAREAEDGLTEFETNEIDLESDEALELNDETAAAGDVVWGDAENSSLFYEEANDPETAMVGDDEIDHEEETTFEMARDFDEAEVDDEPR